MKAIAAWILENKRLPFVPRELRSTYLFIHRGRGANSSFALWELGSPDQVFKPISGFILYRELPKKLLTDASFPGGAGQRCRSLKF
jgi:hypothetical protein